MATDDPIITYDPDTRVVTVDGFRFSRELFSQFTTSPLGVRFRVISRECGIVTVSQDRDPLEAAALDLLRALSEAADAVDAALEMVERGRTYPIGGWLREVRDRGRALIAETQRTMP